MAKLVWDETGKRLFETGVEKCALYVYDSEADTKYGTGVAWNGVTAINETPTGAEATDLYADDKKYLSLLSAEELEGTIEAYTYPDAFMACDGSASAKNGAIFGQQSRKQFCLAFITKVGNDTEDTEYGEKLHIIYNCKASPSERAYATINDSPEAITFSWSFKATKENVTTDGMKDTALVTINSKTVDDKANPLFTMVCNKLFGTENEEPQIMLPDAIAALEANG